MCAYLCLDVVCHDTFNKFVTAKLDCNMNVVTYDIVAARTKLRLYKIGLSWNRRRQVT